MGVVEHGREMQGGDAERSETIEKASNVLGGEPAALPTKRSETRVLAVSYRASNKSE